MKILLLLFAVSCGSSHEHNDPPKQQPPAVQPPATGGGGAKPSYAQIQSGVLTPKCLPCHGTAKFMQSETQLRQSSVLARVRGRSMPPPSSAIKLTEDERALILNFF